MVTNMVENQYTDEILMNISLREAKNSSISRRADTAISVLREKVSRYVKIEKDKIWLDSKVNEIIWSHGRKNIPSNLKIKVIKLSDGTAEIVLP